jgi:ATP phosphoribosyltransferase
MGSSVPNGTVNNMLKLVLPKGSLETATMQLFHDADLTVRRSSEVDYRATIDDPRVNEVRILRPQEIPTYVADGLFDVGIAGRDWIEETSSDVVSLGQMKYSKATARPVRIVLAVPADSAYESITDLPQGVRISSEYPELTNRHFTAAGIEADIRLSYGATEAKAPDIVDAVVDLTETGSALKAAGLKIIDEILTSYTEIFANSQSYADPEKRKAMEQIKTLLDGVLDARGRVLMKLNVGAAQLDQVISVLPSMKAPTVNELWGGGGFAVETVVNKGDINILIPELLDLGATDVIEIPISKIVP